MNEPENGRLTATLLRRVVTMKLLCSGLQGFGHRVERLLQVRANYPLEQEDNHSIENFDVLVLGLAIRSRSHALPAMRLQHPRKGGAPKGVPPRNSMVLIVDVRNDAAGLLWAGIRGH